MFTVDLNPAQMPQDSFERVEVHENGFTTPTTAGAIRAAGEIMGYTGDKTTTIQLVKALTGGDLRNAKMIVDAAIHLGLGKRKIVLEPRFPVDAAPQEPLTLGELLRKKLEAFDPNYGVAGDEEDDSPCDCSICRGGM